VGPVGESETGPAVGVAKEKVKMKGRKWDQQNHKWNRLMVLAIAWLTILAGCSYEWKKPRMTEALFKKDTGKCEDYVRTHYFLRRAAKGMRRKKSTDDGRVTYFTEYPPRSQIEAHLFGECMKKKGYRLMEKKTGNN